MMPAPTPPRRELTESGVTDAALGGIDVAARARRGVLLITGRGFLLRLLGLLSIVVLTKFLSPREFGILAIGTTVLGLSNIFNDGGVGAALLRRKGEPTKAELRGVVGIQFGLTLGIWTIALGVAVATRSTIATVTAVMLTALPLGSLKTPAMLLLEREMAYAQLIKAEFAEWFVYTAVALTSVILGAGIWGVAAASVLKLLAGIAILWSTVPGAVALPSVRVTPVLPMLSFGAQFQSVAIIAVLRDHGLNLLVAAAGGLTALGLWSIAGRVLLVVGIVLESLWRVSFPAMARMLETNSDPRRIIERTVAQVAAALGLVLVPVVTFGPEGIPFVFGSEWRDAADVLPGACLGYAVAGPVSTACAGYLYARGDARTILVSTIMHTIVILAAVALLMPAVGLAAIGLGLLGASIVDVVVIGRRTRRAIHVALLAPTAVLVVTASLAAAAGLAVSALIGQTPLSIPPGVLCGLLTYGALVALAHRWLLPARHRVDLAMLVRHTLVSARGH